MKNDIIQIVTNTTVIKFLILALSGYVGDFLTGYFKAWKAHNVQSAKLRGGIEKFINYSVFLFIGFIVDFVLSDFINNSVYFTVSFSIAISLIELKSIDENLKETGLSLKDLINKISDISKNIK